MASNTDIASAIEAAVARHESWSDPFWHEASGNLSLKVDGRMVSAWKPRADMQRAVQSGNLTDAVEEWVLTACAKRKEEALDALEEAVNMACHDLTDEEILGAVYLWMVGRTDA